MDPDYRLILDTLGEATIAAERTGRIVYANRAAEELLGWPSGGLRGVPITAIVPPHLRSRHNAGFNRYRSSWQPRILGKRVRMPARRRNGVEVPVELTITSFRGRGGQELYVASLHDVALRSAPERGVAGAGSISALLEAVGLLETGPATTEVALARKVEAALTYHFDAAAAQLWFWDAAGAAIRPPNGGLEAAPAPPAEVLECARSRAPVRVDGGGAPITAAGVETVGAVGGLVALPVWCGDELGGVLMYALRAPLTADALRPVDIFCRLVGGALDRYRRLEAEARVERQARILAALAALAGLAAGEVAASERLELAVTLALELTDLDEGFVLQRTGRGAEGKIIAAAGSKQLVAGELLPEGTSAASLALSSGGTVALADHRLLQDASPQLRQRGVRAAIAVPIIVRGEARAALQLASRKSGRVVSAEDQETAVLLASQAAVILASAADR